MESGVREAEVVLYEVLYRVRMKREHT